MPLLTREAVRAIDADASARLGVPSIVLMENAGRGAFDALVRTFPGALAAVGVVGGPGQNGGDGWVVARHLVLKGAQPRCVLIGERAKLRGDALVNLTTLERLGIEVASASESDLAP